MKTTIIIISLMVISSLSIFSQGKLNGIVYYQNSGGKTANGVKISAFGSNSAYSTESGMFTLAFKTKKPGDKIKLIIGSIDGESKNIEVVNQKQLDWLRIPNKPGDDIVEIIICFAGERDRLAVRYYDILLNATNTNFDNKIKKLEDQINKKNLTANAVSTLIKQLDDLREQHQDALEKIETQATYIASINKDNASELVIEAIQKLEDEKDIDTAILVLDNNKLEESYQMALKKKQTADKEINQVIEAYKLKASLLYQKNNIPEEIICLEKILHISKENQVRNENLISIYNELGLANTRTGKYEEASKYYKEAIQLSKLPDFMNYKELAISYLSLSVPLRSLGKDSVALKYVDVAEKTMEKNGIKDTMLLINAYTHKSAIYRALGNYTKASSEIRKTLEILKNDTLFRNSNIELFASCYTEYGAILLAQGKYSDAIVAITKAVKIQEEIQDFDGILQLSRSYDILGVSYHFSSKIDEAKDILNRSLKLKKSILPKHHDDIINTRSNLAHAYTLEKDYLKAAELYRENQVSFERMYDSLHPSLILFYNNIGKNFGDLNEQDSAVVYLKKSIEIGEAIWDDFHPSMMYSYANLGVTYRIIPDYKNAIKYLSKGYEVAENTLREGHPIRAKVFGLLTETKAYHAFSDKQYSKCIEIIESIPGFSSIPNYLFHIGKSHYYLGDYDTAITHFKAIDSIETVFNNRIDFYTFKGLSYLKKGEQNKCNKIFTICESNHPETPDTYMNWSIYYSAIGEDAKCLNNLNRAIDLGFDNYDWLDKEEYFKELKEKFRTSFEKILIKKAAENNG